MVLGAQMIMIGIAVNLLFFWIYSFIYVSGRVALWTKACGLYTFMVVILAPFFIQQWGFTGVVSLVAAGKVIFVFAMVAISKTILERPQ